LPDFCSVLFDAEMAAVDQRTSYEFMYWLKTNKGHILLIRYDIKQSLKCNQFLSSLTIISGLTINRINHRSRTMRAETECSVALITRICLLLMIIIFGMAMVKLAYTEMQKEKKMT